MAKFTLRVKQGATYKLAFWWRTALRNLTTEELILGSDGIAIPSTPMDLTGYTARMQVRPTIPSSEVLLELTDTDGITIHSPASTIKEYVRAATTANVNLTAAQTIDGVAVVAGDRVLVKNQTTDTENGIYVVASGAWARASDADAFAELTNAVVWVYEGTANHKSQWKQSSTLSAFTGQTWAKDDLTGRIDLIITDEKTTLIPSSGVYDLELTSSSGEVTRILEGKVRLSAEVTRA